ncbi:hypothetical protein JCM10908_003714 [Rhodotorula pacifica]|uniref:uncharacterized protein n=1 Tax=Rhodotorula pacifica TaxID=1495444 RepID=UPI003170C857
MPPRRTLTGRVPKQRDNSYSEHNCFLLDGSIVCFCDQYPRLKARLRTCQSNKNGNRGRKFWSCSNPDEYCDFFIWHDELPQKGYTGPALFLDSDGECDHDGGMYDAGEYGDPECGGGYGGRQSAVASGNKKANSGSSSSKKRKAVNGYDSDSEEEDEDDVQVGGSSSKSKSKGGSPSKKQKKTPLRRYASSGSGTAARTPSPSPSPSSTSHQFQTELARIRAELEREKAEKFQLSQELAEYREENSQLLAKAYPEVFSQSQG